MEEGEADLVWLDWTPLAAFGAGSEQWWFVGGGRTGWTSSVCLYVGAHRTLLAYEPGSQFGSPSLLCDLLANFVCIRATLPPFTPSTIPPPPAFLWTILLLLHAHILLICERWTFISLLLFFPIRFLHT